MPGNQQANWWKDAILTWTYRQLDTPMFGRKNRYFEYELSVCVGFFSPSETSIRCVTSISVSNLPLNRSSYRGFVFDGFGSIS